MTELEPIEPTEALTMYVQDVSGELSPNSVQQKKYQLGKFVEWCDGADADSPRVTDMTALTGRDLTRFKNWRAENINAVTLRTNLSAVRSFLRFCVTIDAVDPSLPQKVPVPELNHGENVRDSLMDAEDADAILDHLRQFEYASMDHVLFLLQWKCGLRMGALHGLDVDDVDVENERIHLHHRPDEGTRLKNGYDGERIVAIDTETATVVTDYITHKRTDATDDYGRSPLFTSPYGRMSKMHLNKHVYTLTSPCEYGRECPADKDPSECEHAGTYDDHVSCPHNVRPHDVRRGSITYWLRNDVPKTVVSDRMDVSPSTLDRHYSKLSEEEKAEQRREYLDDVG